RRDRHHHGDAAGRPILGRWLAKGAERNSAPRATCRAIFILIFSKAQTEIEREGQRRQYCRQPQSCRATFSSRCTARLHSAWDPQAFVHHVAELLDSTVCVLDRSANRILGYFNISPSRIANSPSARAQIE